MGADEPGLGEEYVFGFAWAGAGNFEDDPVASTVYGRNPHSRHPRRAMAWHVFAILGVAHGVATKTWNAKVLAAVNVSAQAHAIEVKV